MSVSDVHHRSPTLIFQLPRCQRGQCNELRKRYLWSIRPPGTKGGAAPGKRRWYVSKLGSDMSATWTCVFVPCFLNEYHYQKITMHWLKWWFWVLIVERTVSKQLRSNRRSAPNRPPPQECNTHPCSTVQYQVKHGLGDRGRKVLHLLVLLFISLPIHGYFLWTSEGRFLMILGKVLVSSYFSQGALGWKNVTKIR